MIGAAADQDDILDAYLFGIETIDLSSFDDSSTELSLLAVAPREDDAGGGESEDVVVSTDDLAEGVL